jgi:hypothetical protein
MKGGSSGSISSRFRKKKTEVEGFSNYTFRKRTKKTIPLAHRDGVGGGGGGRMKNIMYTVYSLSWYSIVDLACSRVLLLVLDKVKTAWTPEMNFAKDVKQIMVETI